MVSDKKLYLLSVLSGLLFFLAWPPLGFPAILFVAFVPLLQIEDAFSSGRTPSKRIMLFVLSFLSFFIWNVTTTFWVCNASMAGGIMAILANSLLMAMVMWIFHVTKKRLLAVSATAAVNWLLPILWIAYEYFHHRWDVTWPWLTLGNAFAANYTWIQWYEYTGVPGGSLWVLAVNLMVFELLKKKFQFPNFKLQVGKIVLMILVPIAISLLIYYSYKELPDPVNIVVVQPNIDPFSEKFDGMNFEEQLNKMLHLAKQKVDTTTDYLVFPETALTESIRENELKQTASVHILKGFLKPYPELKIVIGASTLRLYEEGEKRSATAHKFKRQEGYYDVYNTALQIDNTDSIQVYHKSKLVPGVERMPYPVVFGFLEDLAIDLGGTAGSLGMQEERGVFTAPSNLPAGRQAPPEGGELSGIPKSPLWGVGEASVAPVICYESIFGEFVTDYIRNGATLIFIITNDGWWRDTPGYKQHLIYGRLRAIETRRSIARSANTGISCFINARGDFSQETEWWEPAVIQESINSNSGETFYVRFGDSIGRVCFYAAVVVIIISFLLLLIKKSSAR